MSYINNVHASQWIEENMPENGLFRVYWTEKDGPGYANSIPSFEDTGLSVRYEFMCKNGKRADGVSTGWWPDGSLKNQYTWKDGKYHGLFIDWHDYKGGYKKEERNYKDDKLDGLWTNWYDNGQKEAEITYKDHLICGKLKRWYRDGSVMYETEFENGCGIDKVYYQNGQKKSEGTYKNGKQDGLWIDWHPNGQKSWERSYKDGDEDGLTTGWYENGQKEREEIFKDRHRNGSSTRWNKNGQEIFEMIYEEGKIISKTVNVDVCGREKDYIIKKFSKEFYEKITKEYNKENL